MPAMRQFVSVRPENPSHVGDSIRLQKWNWFDESAVTAAKTPLTEEADVSPVKMPATSTVDLVPDERGFVVTTTEYFAKRTLAPFDEFKARAIVDHAAKVHDEVLQDVIKAGITEEILAGTENTTDYQDVLTADKIREVVTTFQENNVPTWDGQFYVAVIHPRVANDVRSEAGPGGWRVAKEYIDDSLIRRGEIGEFEGVRFMVNNRVRKGTGSATGTASGGQASSYNNYFFGQRGLAEFAKTDVEVRLGPGVDNLNRFRTLGWYSDIAWEVYEPLAIQDVISGASLG